MTIKDAKLNFITDVAAKLFFEKSIAAVTVKDISLAAGVGEATVYRYFTHKQNIVTAVAEKLQGEVYGGYFCKERSGNGYEKLSAFYGNYLDIFNGHREFYQFVGEFDSFLLAANQTAPKAYSDGVTLFEEIFLAAYNEGVKDGSVRALTDPERFYFSTTHALLELCKKLATEKAIVLQDIAADKAEEISELIQVFLSYLAVPQA
ncbi:MAG: helix-turn-helix transcriptional regulator [Clostridia bacterium]|nr:helix-turn-helix transcriptional regulator [Clostridia bacterium]